MNTRWAESALSWWDEAGVDTIVGEQPRDWLVQPKPESGKSAEPALPPSPAPSESLPDDLPAFQAWLAATDAIPFASPADRRIPPAGAATSGLMVIGDAPSPEDVAAGRLFTGAQGDLLDRMLSAIGLGRDSVYLAPFAPISPPTGKIDQAGVAFLARLMRHHVGLVAPQALLVFGDGCSRALFGAPTASTRGRWLELETPRGPVRTIVTIRPKELLKQPRLKSLAWADLQRLKEELR